MRASRSIRGMLSALALAAAAVLGGAGSAQGQDARVLGRVTDGVGNPVAGAQVTLVAEGGATLQTVTGAGGGFQFSAVAPGSYTLRASAAGVPAQERRITVRAGQVMSQVVRLRRGRAGQAASASRSDGRP